MIIEEFAAWVEAGCTRKGGEGENIALHNLRELSVMTLGLSGEIGEVVGEIVIHGSHITERIKKEIRGDGDLDRTKLKLELGDVLHYLCRIASHYEISMRDIMIANYDKIEARRGKRAWETK